MNSKLLRKPKDTCGKSVKPRSITLRPLLLLVLTFSIVCFKACLSGAVSGDTVYLKGARNSFNIDVIKITESYLTAKIQRSRIDKLSINPDNNSAYPDSARLNDRYQTEIKCKMVGITNNYFTFKLPMSFVETLELDDNANTGAENGSYSHSNTQTYQRQDSATYRNDDNPLNLELLEDESYNATKNRRQSAGSAGLIRESLPNLQAGDYNEKQQYQDEGPLDPEKFKEQIKKEIMDAMSAKEVKDEKEFLRENMGKVRGKIVRRDGPLPNCKVQIVALTQKRVMLMKVVKRGKSLETVTDQDGYYFFDNVPPGSYKIFWKPSYEKSWIRRLDMKPDIIVSPGRTTSAKTINTKGRTLN